jgi:iron complex transport system ATP-binding protein
MEDVLTNISLTLNQGEMLGIVGPNGSGKSTLVRSITHALKPRQGSIRISGRGVAEMGATELARLVAVVPQSAILPEGFSALEIALMGRTPYLRLLQSEGPEDLRIARRSLLNTGSLSYADRMVQELSGGERQRVIVARAIAQESPVLLLDEPTVHLDIGHQIALLDLVRKLIGEQGLSVVAVIHDLTLAGQYCDRLMMLGNGQVVTEGEPGDVLRPEIIHSVYDVDVRVLSHPDTGKPVIVPVPGSGRVS